MTKQNKTKEQTTFGNHRMLRCYIETGDEALKLGMKQGLEGQTRAQRQGDFRG
jgi:hypothetical protein